MKGLIFSALEGDYICDYCHEPFFEERYTITINGKSYGSFCLPECQLGYNRHKIGPPGDYLTVENTLKKQNNRQVFCAPDPQNLKWYNPKKGMARKDWLPITRNGLDNESRKRAASELWIKDRMGGVGDKIRK